MLPLPATRQKRRKTKTNRFVLNWTASRSVLSHFPIRREDMDRLPALKAKRFSPPTRCNIHFPHREVPLAARNRKALSTPMISRSRRRRNLPRVLIRSTSLAMARRSPIAPAEDCASSKQAKRRKMNRNLKIAADRTGRTVGSNSTASRHPLSLRPSGIRCIARHGGSSAITSGQPICPAWTGNACINATCRC